jgi:hypothetical protein
LAINELSPLEVNSGGLIVSQHPYYEIIIPVGGIRKEGKESEING